MCNLPTTFFRKAKLQRQNSSAATSETLLQYKELEEKERGQNENAENEAIRDERPFKYGDICQLQHVLTGKFVTMDGQTLAEADNEALRISIVEDGGKGSWLEFQPRFKNRAMGQPVNIGDQLVFRHVSSITQYLRVSEGFLKFSEGSIPEMTEEALKTMDAPDNAIQYYKNRCELNLSAAQPYSALKIKLYAAGSAEGMLDAETNKVVLNLQMGTMALRFFHAESDAMVSASANQHAAFHPTNQDLKLPYLFTKKADEDDDLDDEKNLVSKSLWIVENVNRSEGGGLIIAGDPQVIGDKTFHQKTDLVRIRHVVSGRYLAVDHKNFTDEESAFKPISEGGKGLTKLENTGPIFNVRLCETLNSFDKETNPSFTESPNSTDDTDVRTLFKLHSVVGPSGEEDTCPILTMEDIETQNIWIEHPFVKLNGNVAEVVPIFSGGTEWSSCWLHSPLVPKPKRENELFDRKSLTLKFCGQRLDEDSLQIFVAQVKESLLNL
jgi:hypothetical protein